MWYVCQYISSIVGREYLQQIRGAFGVKLEDQVLLTSTGAELLSTFPSIELTGDPIRVRSNLNNALKVLPVRLAR